MRIAEKTPIYCMTRNSNTSFLNHSSEVLQVITQEEEMYNYIRINHEGMGDSIQARAVSGHSGRDKTVAFVTSKRSFPSLLTAVSPANMRKLLQSLTKAVKS